MNDRKAWLRQLQGKSVVDDLFEIPARVSEGSWQPFRSGIDILPLYGDQQGKGTPGPSAALLRYSPGASVPTHEHTGYEHVVVLQGSQRDGQEVYGSGSFVISDPGSRHAVTSDHGCVVLVIWNQPVSFIDETQPAEETASQGSDT